MMILRRRTMMNKKRASEWDYELYKDGSYVPFLRIDVNAGQNIFVSYKNGVRGYIYDARAAGGNYLRIQDISEKEGTVSFTVMQDGQVAFSGHYESGQTHYENSYTGEYLKIRIE